MNLHGKGHRLNTGTGDTRSALSSPPLCPGVVCVCLCVCVEGGMGLFWLSQGLPREEAVGRRSLDSNQDSLGH